MNWRIVSDSSCNIYHLEKNDAGIKFSCIPFVVSLDEVDYLDTEDLNVPNLIDIMDNCKTSVTACSSPGEWLDAFGEEENVVAVTISSKLSGSYNSALAAKEMALEENPDRKIEIIDSKTAGPEQTMIVEKLQSLITEGLDFDSVVSGIKEYMKSSHIIFALSSYGNFVRNGRIPKIAGLVAGNLKLMGIGIGSDEGTVDIKKITRGSKRVIDFIIKDIKNRSTNCKSVLIAHCQNLDLAEGIKKAVIETVGNIEVRIMHTRGLCSYYAEKNGVIVGFC